LIVTHFDPADDLIIVIATIWGVNGRHRRVQLAVDTGASETLLIPDVTVGL
jgi:hypothetical protein